MYSDDEKLPYISQIEGSDYDNLVNYFTDPITGVDDSMFVFNSDYSSSILSLSSTNGQQGESGLTLTIILDLFFVKNSRHSGGKTRAHPKKENLNTFIVRAIKNIFRLIIQSKKTRKSSLKIDPRNIEQNKCWVKLGEIYRNDPQFIINLAKPDGRSENNGNREVNTESKEESKNSERSINTSYCRNFYSSELTKSAYAALIGIFFSEMENDKLFDRFGFSCCETKEHLESCIDKWRKLKAFLEEKYLQSFDIPILTIFT